jgi:hypothetical protein
MIAGKPFSVVFEEELLVDSKHRFSETDKKRANKL